MIENKIGSVNKQFQDYQSETKALEGRFEGEFAQVDKEYAERQQELKDERMYVKEQRKRLLEEEIKEKQAIREKEQYSLEVASKIFQKNQQQHTIARTKIVLNLVQNTMMQILTNTNNLNVMFTEFSIRLKTANARFKSLSTDMADPDTW